MNTNKKSSAQVQSAAPNVPKTVWIAAPPKSGSTWLSKLVGASLGWQMMSLQPRGYPRREQELVATKKFRFSESHVFVPHHHTKASELTIEIVKNYNIRVILMTRDIYDMTLSLIDHLEQDGVNVPIGFIPISFKGLPFEQRARAVAKLLIPWYISFYASWAYAQHDHKLNVHIVSYESLHDNTLRTLASCITFAGEMRNVDVMNGAITRVKKEETRFNVGTVGRGHQELSADVKGIIDDLMQQHTDPIIQKMLSYVTPNRGHGNSAAQEAKETGNITDLPALSVAHGS
jgi:hypothetical protein